ncbi:MAG: class I SAM-dependent methyltransferase [Saprospiraceae bacterium]|nr:class I SAM-dependent methyltransferase [Saprospiraceae bacterium]
MQDRHSNRSRYFTEQGITTFKYVIPYIESVKPIDNSSVVLEIGCGEGGNLHPFLDKGIKVFGIELLKHQYDQAIQFYRDHKYKNNLTLIHSNIYDIDSESLPKMDVIFMKDVIEHIPDQNKLLSYLHQFLKPDGIIFFGFPPWRMPFGGHQQVCRSILSKVPYFHILPSKVYELILKLFGEDELAIKEFLEVKETGLSINRFHKIVKENKYSILKETYWFINPNYEIKFKLKPRRVPRFLQIPWLCDFYTTAIYCAIRPN